MNADETKIPDFRPDGYLPEGMFVASEAEFTFRFGSSNKKRRRLMIRVRRWIELARETGALRLFVDASFVTAERDPNDVDAVVFIAPDFEQQVAENFNAAVEFEEMLMTRRPEEIFAAEDETDWDDWVEFFSQTREADERRKGLVEIEL